MARALSFTGTAEQGRAQSPVSSSMPSEPALRFLIAVGSRSRSPATVRMRRWDETIPSPRLVSNNAIKKKRIGLDLQKQLGLYDFKVEVAVGDDDGKAVAGGMAEIGYVLPENQDLKLKMQTMYWSNDWEEKNSRDLTIAPVVEYKVNPAATVRLGYFHDLYSSSDEDKAIILQFYYFGL